MTIADAIRAADHLRQSDIRDELKIKWLSDLDGQCWEDVVSRYEGAPEQPVYPPDIDTEAAELLIQAPHDNLYVDYLVMRIDLENGDLERYNAKAAMFDSAWQRWANTYNRSHRWRNSTPGLRF